MTDVETLLAQIAEIGATPDGGVRRLAWTDEDARLGQWFAAACAERGLDVGTDRCGNQWAWWGDPGAAVPSRSPHQTAGEASDGHRLDADGHVEMAGPDSADAQPPSADGRESGDGSGVSRGSVGSEPSDEAQPSADQDGTLPHGGVVTGSHLDSVPGGGAYDGPLGVVTALAAIDQLKAAGFTPRRAIGIVRFVDEEGARFGVPCAGSRLLTGQLQPGDVLNRTDVDGVSYGEAAGKAGLDVDAIGRDDAALQRVGAFLEVHVEQGFTLAAEEVDAPLGVCGLIRPHGRWRVDMHGRGDHAGTARFVDRSDPMLELARLVSTVRSAASRQDALGTVGKVEVHPNVPNAVPSRIQAWVDIRADTAGQVRSVASEIQAMGFELAQESWTPATPLGGPLTDRVSKVAGAAAGIGPLPVLATGAGHDAGVLATAGVPSAMIFVRNPTGISHAPQEQVQPDDAAVGVRSLAAVLADLSR